MKRNSILSILIALVMILQSFVCIQAFAGEATAESPEIQTIADFGTIEGIEKSGITEGAALKPSVEETYGDANTSVKMDVKKLISGTVSTTGVDWSEYAYFRMRIYADKTGDVLNLIAATAPTADLAYNPYMRQIYTVAKTGWHDVTIKLSAFTKNSKPLSEGGASHVPSWNEMTAFYLSIGHWDTAFTAGGSIYIDEIWLEKDSVDYSAADSMVDSTDKVLADYNSIADTYAMSGFYPQSTNTRPDGNGVYAMWDIQPLKLASKFFYNDEKNAINVSDYSYVNVWMYSPAPQDGGMLIVFKNSGGLKANALTKTVDWKGWKLISLKIPAYTSVTQIYLCVNGWPNNNAMPGSSTSRWFNNGCVGVEKVWLSEAPVTDPNTVTVPATAEPYDYSDDVYPATNFDAEDAFVDGAGAALKGIAKNTDNTYKSGVSARLKWNKAYNNSTQMNYFTFKAAGDMNQTSDEIKNTKIPAEVIKNNDYNYANFLVYNPGKKHYNAGSTVNTTTDPVSDILFVALYGGSPSDSNFSGNYGHKGVDANWTGWKVVSLPLTAKADTNGIYSLYINAGGWSDAYQGWCDIGNYIDVDSIWLSKTAYEANTLKSASVADGSEDVSVYIDGSNTLTYTFSNNLSENSKAGISVYKNYEPVDTSLYTVEIDGKNASVVFNDKLDETCVYTVKFDKDMTDGCGVKLGKTVSSSFSTENIRVESDILTIIGDNINGFKDMTLAEVRNALTYTDGATLVFKNSAGTEITDETIVAKSGMYALVSNEFASRELKLDTEFSSIENIKLYMNGEETTVAFTTGTLEVKGTANCYKKTATASVALILAQYEGNKLININYTPQDVTGSENISATIDFEKVADTSLAIFSWNSIGGLCPIGNVIKLDVGKYLWMPSVFATGAVMQRDTELNIWGEAAPGCEVTVTLGDKTYKTTAASDASWSITADAITPENNPYSMTVTTTGGGKLEFTDILAGDVWLCSGQSNMEWQMRRVAGEAADATIKAQAKADIANSANNNIRLYNQSKNGTAEILKDTKDGAWQYCTSANVNNFSAVGYYFGRELEADLDVPVGLINASYGGAAIQSFLDADTIAENNISYTVAKDPMRDAGKIFNAMVAPIIPYSLKGVLWYQGCANASADADTAYYTLQDIWTSSWRNLWNDADMPFVLTQLAAYNANNYQLVREAQYQFANDKDNVELAVIYEAGEKSQIHPGDKMTVGHRLALAAKGGVYGLNVQYKYPKAASFTVEGTTLTVTFDDVYDGLKLKDGDTTLNGFEILTSDGTWVAATAAITGKNTVSVTDGTNVPVGVRAAFTGYAEPMYNLFNSADLLATPFRLTK